MIRQDNKYFQILFWNIKSLKQTIKPLLTFHFEKKNCPKLPKKSKDLLIFEVFGIQKWITSNKSLNRFRILIEWDYYLLDTLDRLDVIH